MDRSGSSEAQYWIARHRLREKFGLSAAEADAEMQRLDEVMINLQIMQLDNERQEKDNMRNR